MVMMMVSSLFHRGRGRQTEEDGIDVQVDPVTATFGSIFFVIGWLLIVRDDWPCLPPIGRPLGALFGASLFVITGLLSADKAFDAISLETIALLLGVMLITQIVEEMGGFQYLIRLLGKAGTSPVTFLIRTSLLGALSAALVTNDTTCLFLTPIVARSCVSRGFNPAPFLLSLATSTNIGSAATPIGSPQNIIIAALGGVSFLDFLRYILLASLVGLLINVSLILFAYRGNLYINTGSTNSRPAGDQVEVVPPSGHVDHVSGPEQTELPSLASLQQVHEPRERKTVIRLIDFTKTLKGARRYRLRSSLPHLLPMPAFAENFVYEEDLGTEDSQDGGISEVIPDVPERQEDGGLEKEKDTHGARSSSDSEQLPLAATRQRSRTIGGEQNRDRGTSLRSAHTAPHTRKVLDRYTHQLRRQRAMSLDEGKTYLEHLDLVDLEEMDRHYGGVTLMPKPEIVARRSSFHPIMTESVWERWKPRVQRLLVGLLLPAMVTADQWVGLPWTMCFGAVLLLLARGKSPDEILDKVDAKLLLFFSSLFVLVSGFSETQIPEKLWQMSSSTIGELNTPEGLVLYAAVIVFGSNTVSNVPLVLLLAPEITNNLEGDAAKMAWLQLSWLSTIAGNLTLVGSVANLIVTERAKPWYKLGFMEYLKVGMPSTLLMVAQGLPLVAIAVTTW